MYSLSQLLVSIALATTIAREALAGERPYMITIEHPVDGLPETGPNGVTSDGQMVFGYSLLPEQRIAFRWTRNGGVQVALDSYGAPLVDAEATAAGGGVVAVSQSRTGGFGHTIRWMEDGTLLDVGIDRSTPVAVSLDGTVIVGNSAVGAYRWTQQGGSEILGHFTAIGVSANGAIVAGTLQGGGVVKWTQASGLVDMGVPGGFARAISPDGAIIAVWASDGRALLVRANGITQIFDDVDRRVKIEGISGDGSIAVATLFDDWGSWDGVAIWTQEYGSTELWTFLYGRYGLAWDFSIYTVDGISADGRTIVGRGVGLDDNHARPWLAFLGSGCGTPGDIDQDGEVGIADLSLLLAHFGDWQAAPFQGDIDWDGIVGQSDLTTLLANFGSRCPA